MEMTVKELREFLSKYPDDMPVGIQGHFGEFHNLIGIYKRNVMMGITSWEKDMNADMKDVIIFDVPDIGQEPD